MLFLFQALLLIFLVYMIIKSYFENKAFDHLMEASENFEEWRKNNPRVYVGLSEQGRFLTRKLIKCRDIFNKFFPSPEHNDHRKYLVSLLDEFPPSLQKP